MRRLLATPADLVSAFEGHPMGEKLDDGTEIEMRTPQATAVSDKVALILTRKDFLRLAAGEVMTRPLRTGENIVICIPTAEELREIIAKANVFCQENYHVPPVEPPSQERLVELTTPIPYEYVNQYTGG
jgi:hypothetical protein